MSIEFTVSQYYIKNLFKNHLRPFFSSIDLKLLHRSIKVKTPRIKAINNLIKTSYCWQAIRPCNPATSPLNILSPISYSKQTTSSVTTPNNGGTTPGTPTTPTPAITAVEVKVEEEKLAPDFLDAAAKAEEKSKIGFPSSQMSNLNVGDYRTLVKTLVCGVKTITWGCASCKVCL